MEFVRRYLPAWLLRSRSHSEPLNPVVSLVSSVKPTGTAGVDLQNSISDPSDRQKDNDNVIPPKGSLRSAQRPTLTPERYVQLLVEAVKNEIFRKDLARDLELGMCRVQHIFIDLFIDHGQQCHS